MNPLEGFILVNHVRGLKDPSLYTNPSKIQKRTTIYQIVINVTKTLYKPYIFPSNCNRNIYLDFLYRLRSELKTLGSASQPCCLRQPSAYAEPRFFILPNPSQLRMDTTYGCTIKYDLTRTSVPLHCRGGRLVVSVRALVNDEFVMFLVSACIRNLRALVAVSLISARKVREHSFDGSN